MSNQRALRAIKLAHTVIWAFFVACIIAIPVYSWAGRYAVAGWLSVVVLFEALIVVFNSWRCPLTAVAARYTSDRRDNFDIYLPLWLARYNKQVFGTLWLAGVAFTLYEYMTRSG